MIKNKDLIDRFFRYVRIDTQSAEDTGTSPSTAKQHDLAKVLYSELTEMGAWRRTTTANTVMYTRRSPVKSLPSVSSRTWTRRPRQAART